jgi:hypothetical protein
MSPLKFLPAASLAVLLAAISPSLAQQPNTEFKITKVEPSFVESPTYSGPRYDKRGAKAGSWLEVEVTFDWQPRLKEPKYTEELTANFYILLNNPNQQFPKGALLTGSVNLMSIPQGRDMHTVVYVSPRTLERMFDGKAPGTAAQAVTDIGVTLSKQGQVVATTSWKSKSGEWWPQFQQTPGYVLNKNETPFAPLAWDYYEAIKPKGPGF